jgi:hypothetical protein
MIYLVLVYLALQSEIEKVPTHDVTIVMGDLNAKVGNDNTGNERVMGKYGCSNINDNGERLVDLCGTNNLVIGGTFFPHIILSFTGAYSNIAFVTFLFIIIATLPWCFSSFLPEYTIVSPVLVILLPHPMKRKQISI